MNVSLVKNIEAPKSKYLVFTSAGENANIDYWAKGTCNFDLWVCYYGDCLDRYRDQCDFYVARKGGKFPNFKYIYQHWKAILSQYQAIILMDDDIIISGSDISLLFEIREQYDLWIAQPAFDIRGKISHPITKKRGFSFLRYTNFVEVTCPIFRTDKLEEFIEVFDPILVGWGIDWWYMDLLAADSKDKVAIIDKISCINPHDRNKGGQREIELLEATSLRIENWGKIKKKYNIIERPHQEFQRINLSLNFSNIVNFLYVLLIRYRYKLAQKVRYFLKEKR